MRRVDPPLLFALACAAPLACGDSGGGDSTTVAATETGTDDEIDGSDSSGEDSSDSSSDSSDSATSSDTLDSSSEDSGSSDSSGSDTSSDTGDSGSEGSTTDTGTDTGGETDTGGDIDENCAEGETWPYAGPLCGPLGTPCVIEADIELAPPGNRVDAPSLALGDLCQPHLLFGLSEGGYQGFYATRNPDWELEDLPTPLARGALVVNPATQVPTAVIDDGNQQVSIWRREGSWQELEAVSGPNEFDHGLVRDLGGVTHVGYRSAAGNLRYAAFDGGAWAASNLVGKGRFINVDASVTGDPQLLAWSEELGGWQLSWQGLAGAPELVAAHTGFELLRGQNDLAIVGGELEPPGVPHLIYARRPDLDAPLGLYYATREAPDLWTELPITAEAELELCDGTPAAAGLQCNYDYTRVYPLAAVASEGGDVRLLWAEHHHQGVVNSQCVFQVGCFWVPGSDSSVGGLHLGWPTADAVDSVVLGESFAVAGTAALDPGGRVHLAVYDRAPGSGDASVRYLRFGP